MMVKKNVPITIVMITFNEAHYLPGLLEEVVDWADSIHIVDSLSTDKTVDIALQYGVTIVQRPFTDFGGQWNWALENLPINTPWTMKLDPDERMSDKLKAQIENTVTSQSPEAGYIFPRRLWWLGRPLHVTQEVLRLWKSGSCRFSNTIVNEQPLINGLVGQLSGTLEHLDSKDLHHWLDKQNRYSTMEAIMRYRGDRMAVSPKLFGSRLERRLYFKKVFWKLPLRYQLLYLYHLIGLGVWRDGMEGRIWARLRTEVYRMCEMKYEEIRKSTLVPDIPKVAHGDYDRRILETDLQKQLVPESILELA